MDLGERRCPLSLPARRLLTTNPGLLLYSQNRVLCGLRNTKFNNGLGWNLDLLLRFWIKAHPRLPLLLHQLAKTGQDKFAILFRLFVGERAKRIEEDSSGFFVGLGGLGKCGLKFCLGHWKRIGSWSIAQEALFFKTSKC